MLQLIVAKGFCLKIYRKIVKCTKSESAKFVALQSELQELLEILLDYFKIHSEPHDSAYWNVGNLIKESYEYHWIAFVLITIFSYRKWACFVHEVFVNLL